MWILLSCQRLCVGFRNLYAVTKTPPQGLKQKHSHPIMSSIVRKMRCQESFLVLWFPNASEFPGYYWICYSVYTHLIAEIDAINFVFSTFCQLSRLTFISNRINEGVSRKPTNLNWPTHVSGLKYIPENPSIACVSHNSRYVSGLFWKPVSRYRFVSIVKDKLFESQFRALKRFWTFQKRPLWSQISYNSFWLFELFWFSVNPLFWRCAGNNWPVLFLGCFQRWANVCVIIPGYQHVPTSAVPGF